MCSRPGTNYIGLEVSGSVYNAGNITAGSSFGHVAALFHKELTNTGTIIAQGVNLGTNTSTWNQSLEVIGTVYNSGIISIGNIGKTSYMKSEIDLKGSPLFLYGSALFHSDLINSNKIIAHGVDFDGRYLRIGLEVTGTVDNSPSGNITVYTQRTSRYCINI